MEETLGETEGTGRSCNRRVAVAFVVAFFGILVFVEQPSSVIKCFIFVGGVNVSSFETSIRTSTVRVNA